MRRMKFPEPRRAELVLTYCASSVGVAKFSMPQPEENWSALADDFRTFLLTADQLQGVILNSDRAVAPLVGCFHARSATKLGGQPLRTSYQAPQHLSLLLAPAAKAGVVATNLILGVVE